MSPPDDSDLASVSLTIFGNSHDRAGHPGSVASACPTSTKLRDCIMSTAGAVARRVGPPAFGPNRAKKNTLSSANSSLPKEFGLLGLKAGQRSQLRFVTGLPMCACRAQIGERKKTPDSPRQWRQNSSAKGPELTFGYYSRIALMLRSSGQVALKFGLKLANERPCAARPGLPPW